MAKGPNILFTIWYGLTVHIIRFKNYKQNFPNISFTIWYGLTVHIIRFKNYKQNFQNCLPQSNSSELRKFRAIHPHSP